MIEEATSTPSSQSARLFALCAAVKSESAILYSFQIFIKKARQNRASLTKCLFSYCAAAESDVQSLPPERVVEAVS